MKPVIVVMVESLRAGLWRGVLLMAHGEAILQVFVQVKRFVSGL